MSPQEEETFVLAAIARLGEASAHDIATELGVMTVRHTLGRLVDARRVEKRRLKRPQGDVWVFRNRVSQICEACGRYTQVFGAKHCAKCHDVANLQRAGVTV